MTAVHRGHRELVAAVGAGVLFSYEDDGGLWHLRVEIVDVDLERGEAIVLLYAQGGPPGDPPDTIVPIAEPVPHARARALAMAHVAAHARDPR